MSTAAKFLLMLTLATSAMAESNRLSESPIPGLAASSVVSASKAPLPTPETPEGKRTLALIFGIAALALTYHRVIFRGKQAAE